MKKIHRLSPDQIQKIAAGEVVERPANVVKELLENAIDAGATQISVYIEQAGKQLIRVVDNGCGMHKEDALACFEHHATSKIKSIEDLTSIKTFGFRGEALSSIASVSSITLLTKEADAQEGYSVELEQGMVIKQQLARANTGTDMSIKNLFFNVPARKKFLKTHETELRAIQQLFYAFCLDYSAIHFKLFSEGKLLMQCQPTEQLVQRFQQLLGNHEANYVLPIEENNVQKNIKIHGIISNHQHARYDRSNIFFFVNKRWVKQTKLSTALLKGYMNVIQPGRYPSACIFIEVNPEEVDINIHPRKEEVQFLHPRIIEQLIEKTTKKVLDQAISRQLQRTVFFNPAATPVTPPINTWNQASPWAQDIPLSPKIEKQSYDVTKEITAPSFKQTAAPTPVAAPDIQQTLVINPQMMTDTFYRFIGQLHKTYLLFEHDEGLFIIDQHAAHERILYEFFAKRFQDIATVHLIFPQSIPLTTQEYELCARHKSSFGQYGIGISLADKSLMITTIPVHLKNASMTELIKEMLSWTVEHQAIDQADFIEQFDHTLRAQMACKAAVKAGDSLTTEQITQMNQDLQKIDNRFTCPHGRPTCWLLNTYEIEKKFKRKV